MQRSNHHAQGVERVALGVMGGIIWKSKDIKVHEQKGELKNVLWMKSGSDDFYFTYDHANDEIVVRQRNHSGPELRRFSNQTSHEEIFQFFNAMS